MPEALKYQAKFQGGESPTAQTGSDGAKAFASDYSGGQATYDKVLKDFETANVKLSTGEYVPKSEFDALSSDDQKLLMEKGVAEFSAIKKVDFDKFVAEHVKLSTGEYIPKEAFNALRPERQQLLMDLGVEAYNALPRPVATTDDVSRLGVPYNSILTTSEGWEAFQKEYLGYALPYPPGVNPWRRRGMFYWWGNAPMEAVFGKRPPATDPVWQLKGEYGSANIRPIPEYLEDMSQVAKYLYGDVTKGTRGVLSPVTAAPVSSVGGVNESGEAGVSTTIVPGSIPGFDVYGHAIPNFPPSGAGIKYDAVINGVPYFQGVPVVDVDPKYLDPTYSPYPVKAEVQPVPLDTDEIPVGETYKPGSTMYELGFENEREYRLSGLKIPGNRESSAYTEEKQAARDFLKTGTGETTEEPERDFFEPEQTESEGIVIGTSPTTNEVLVRLADGGTIWKPATAQQLAEATMVLDAGGEYGEAYIIPTDETRGIAPGFTLMSPEEQVEAYNEKLDDFKAKWADYTATGKFKGTREQYERYLDEFRNVQGLAINVRGVVDANQSIAQQTLSDITRLKGIEPVDIKSLTLERAEEVIKQGVSPQLLVDAGASTPVVKQIVDTLNAKAAAQKEALAKMEDYRTPSGSYRLEEYMLSGSAPTDDEIRRAGFSEESILKARTAANYAYAPQPDYDTLKQEYSEGDFDSYYHNLIEEWSTYNREQRELKAIFEAERSPEYVKSGGGTGLGGFSVIFNPKEGYKKVRNLDIGWAFDESGKIINASIKRVFAPTEYEPSEIYGANVGAIGVAQTAGGVSGLAVGTSALTAGAVAYNKLQSTLPEGTIPLSDYTPFSVAQYPDFNEQLDINPPVIPQEFLDVNPPDIPQETLDTNRLDMPQETFDVGNSPDVKTPPMEVFKPKIPSVLPVVGVSNPETQTKLTPYQEGQYREAADKVPGLTVGQWQDWDFKRRNFMTPDQQAGIANLQKWIQGEQNKLNEGRKAESPYSIGTQPNADAYQRWLDMINQVDKEVETAKSHSDYLAYLMKKAMLLQAWQSYIQSLNPSPMPLQKSSVNLLTVYYILEETAYQTLTQALAQGQTQTMAEELAKTATQNAIKSQNLTQTMTEVQKVTMTEQAVKQAVKLAELEAEATKPVTMEAELTKPITAVNEATLSNVAEMADTAEMTDTLTQTATMTTTLDIPLPVLNDTEQGKKLGKRVPPGTIEWRQGKKWVALYPPYTDKDKKYLDYPLPGTYKFAVGKGSAMKTLQVLGGPPTQDADIDMGWAQVHISSKGKELQMSFGGGEQAANDRWSEEREKMEAYERLAYAFDSLPKYSTLEKIPRMKRPKPTYVPEVPDYDPEEDIEALKAKLAYYEQKKKGEAKTETVKAVSDKPFERRYLGHKLRPTPIAMDL